MLRRRWWMRQMLTCGEITKRGGAGNLANCLGGYLSGEWVMPAAPAVPFLILFLICFTGKKPRAPQQNSVYFFLLTVVYFYVAFSSLLLQATCVSLGVILCFVSKLGHYPILYSLFDPWNVHPKCIIVPGEAFTYRQGDLLFLQSVLISYSQALISSILGWGFISVSRSYLVLEGRREDMLCCGQGHRTQGWCKQSQGHTGAIC